MNENDYMFFSLFFFFLSVTTIIMLSFLLVIFKIYNLDYILFGFLLFYILFFFGIFYNYKMLKFESESKKEIKQFLDEAKNGNDNKKVS